MRRHVSSVSFLGGESTLASPLVDITILTTFVVFGVTLWKFRISYRISVLAGLLLLILTAGLVLADQQDIGNLIATLAYGFLVVGTALAILEWRQQEK